MNLYLISKPLIDWRTFSRFQRDEGTTWQYYGDGGYIGPRPDSELLVELCGRLCYMSFGKGRKDPKDYINNLIEKGHFSVFEHSNWTFFFTGISRSLTHELIRHRHFSYSQLSQRYVDHTEFPIHVPKEIEENSRLKPLWEKAIESMKNFYSEALLEFKNNNAVSLKKKELHTVARAILPNAIETKIAVTGNARAWRDFIKTRMTEQSDPEILELARNVLKVLSDEAPLLFEDLKSLPGYKNDCLSKI